MSGDPTEDPTGEDVCPECGGSGRIEGGAEQCPTCGGSGTVTEPVGGG